MEKKDFNTVEAGQYITRHNYSWSNFLGVGTNISWAFRATPSDALPSIKMSTLEKEAVYSTLKQFSEVSDIKFIQKYDGNGGEYTNSASLLFTSYKLVDKKAGFAYLPVTKRASASDKEGDFYYNQTTGPVQQGGYGYLTILHEIGHTIGLEHPGNYDAADKTGPTYANNAYYVHDTRQYSVMSYFEASTIENVTHSYYDSKNVQHTVYASTLLLHDIAAVQRLYGVNESTRKGDTVYGFYSTSDNKAYSISGQKQVVFCIYDGGGNDTLNLSGYNTLQYINLNAEGFSDAGLLTQNISIAKGSEIENAIGGRSNDTIIGNPLSNKLIGNAGSDIIYGRGGADTLSGGLGYDDLFGDYGFEFYTASIERVWDIQAHLVVDLGNASINSGYLEGIFGGDGAFYDNNVDKVPLGAADIIRGNSEDDFIFGGEGNDVIYGDDGYDRLLGGNGNDKIFGGADSDILNGGIGTDTLVGGEGRDTYISFGAKDNIIENDIEGDNFLIMNHSSYNWVNSKISFVQSLSPVVSVVTLDASGEFARGARFDFSGVGGRLNVNALPSTGLIINNSDSRDIVSINSMATTETSFSISNFDAAKDLIDLRRLDIDYVIANSSVDHIKDGRYFLLDQLHVIDSADEIFNYQEHFYMTVYDTADNRRSDISDFII